MEVSSRESGGVNKGGIIKKRKGGLNLEGSPKIPLINDVSRAFRLGSVVASKKQGTGRQVVRVVDHSEVSMVDF